MEVTVDRDLCEANAVCCGLAPAVFELDDNEELQILVQQVPAEQEAKVLKAIDRCPKNALRQV